MAVSIELRKSRTDDRIQPYPGYTMRVEVLNAVEVSDKIFVYHRGIIRGLTKETVDVFDHIADPVDLERVSDAAPTDTMPWYRQSYVEVVAKTITELDDLWLTIQEDVQTLVDSLNNALVDPVTEDVTIS